MFERKLIYKDNSLTNEEWEREWLNMRMGRFTASEIHRLMSDNKSTGFKTYVREKVQELATGDRYTYTNQAMEDGKANEYLATNQYMETNDCIVLTKSFMMRGEHVGASADGANMLGKRILEAKCPKFKTHLKYLELDPKNFKKECKEYYWQIQTNLWAFGFNAADFVTYYPPHWLDIPLTPYRQFEVLANDKDINLLEERLQLAIEYKLELLDKYTIKVPKK